MQLQDTIQALEHGHFDTCLSEIYACTGDDLHPFRERFLKIIYAFQETFGGGDIYLFSVPGRTELGGNHTDHQGGHVLTGSVNLDIIGVAAKRDSHRIQLQSEGFPLDTVDLSDLTPQESEINTSAALIRGVAAKFTELGYPVSGFDVYTTSAIPKGFGLSSSAAFEVLVGNICSALFSDNQMDAVQIAQIGQYAENIYFGKPSGLMDQLGCSVGGVIAVDFKNPAPIVTRASVDFHQEGYALCMLDSHASHADLTPAYAAVPTEMKSIAKMFGKEVLSQITKSAFLSHLDGLRKTCGDRAVLRAFHFFAEDERVQKQIQALQNHDFDRYLKEVRASGHSSFEYLQNVCAYDNPEKQEMAVVIALCEELLNGRGAVRIHGGGFAGAAQAYVPMDMLKSFKMQTEAVLGSGCCHVLQIRSKGGLQLLPYAE